MGHFAWTYNRMASDDKNHKCAFTQRSSGRVLSAAVRPACKVSGTDCAAAKRLLHADSDSAEQQQTTTIYTVPAANSAMIRSLRVTNANASSADITVVQNNAGSATAHYYTKHRLWQRMRQLTCLTAYRVFWKRPTC